MNRIRIGMAISVIIGAIYAAAGLMDSLNDFGIGVAVAALGVIGYGLCDFVEDRHNEAILQTREAVWARRDGGS